MNQFIARYFCDEKIILDLTVESWQEYVYALRNSDEIKISSKHYEVEKVCMNHDGTGDKGMVIYVDVYLKELGETKEPSVRTVGNYYSR